MTPVWQNDQTILLLYRAATKTLLLDCLPLHPDVQHLLLQELVFDYRTKRTSLLLWYCQGVLQDPTQKFVRYRAPPERRTAFDAVQRHLADPSLIIVATHCRAYATVIHGLNHLAPANSPGGILPLPLFGPFIDGCFLPALPSLLAECACGFSASHSVLHVLRYLIPRLGTLSSPLVQFYVRCKEAGRDLLDPDVSFLGFARLFDNTATIDYEEK